MDKNSKIKQFLLGLGLDKYECTIYLVLIKTGILSILEIAKKSEIDRSKVYRRIENLKRAGLVEEIIDEKRRLVKAVTPDHLENLLKTKEEGVRKLRQMFPEVRLQLEGEVGLNEPETKVLFYRGKAGIRQMVWNTLRAKDEVVGYTYRKLSDIIGVKFMTDWRDEFVRRRLYMRDIYSDEYLKNPENIDYNIYPEKHFISKYLPPDQLDIDHQIDIYNNVYAIYNWHKGEVFGVEIYNIKVARMQKQIFEILWRIGKAEKAIRE